MIRPSLFEQLGLFIRRQEARPAWSDSHKVDPLKGAPVKPAISLCFIQHMPNELHVMQHGLRGSRDMGVLVLRVKVFGQEVPLRGFQEGRGDGIHPKPLQPRLPPFPIVLLGPLVLDGRGLHMRGDQILHQGIPAVLIPLGEKSAGLLFLLGLLVEIPRGRLG
ncbi:MAG: hypothetical protein NW703_05670 [Nitrospiraceae bacterium]